MFDQNTTVHTPKSSNFPVNSTRPGGVDKRAIINTPIEERFERITRLCCKLFNVPIAEITIIDRDRLWFKSVQGLNTTECQLKDSFCDFAIKTNEPLIVTNALENSRFSQHPVVRDESHIRFYAGYPIKGPNGENIGTLCILDTKARNFSIENLNFLEDLTALVETELNNISLTTTQSQLIKEVNHVRRQSLLDPLTQLWNRRGIFEILIREHSTMQREGGFFGLIMLDLDHFKQVNDTYGHLVGDEILRQTAKRLIRAVRVYDSVGRFGGEEFLVVMHSHDKSTFTSVAERIHQGINSHPIETSKGKIPATASLGVTYIGQKTSKQLKELIHCADKALYRAKSLGRDRIEYTSCGILAE